MKLLSDVVEYEVGKAVSIKAMRWDNVEQSLGMFVLEEFTRRQENIKYTR